MIIDTGTMVKTVDKVMMLDSEKMVKSVEMIEMIEMIEKGNDDNDGTTKY